MAPLTHVEGLTAGLRPAKRRHSHRASGHVGRRSRAACALVFALVAAVVLASLILPRLAGERPVSGAPSSVKPANDCYEMRVYALNFTERDPMSIGTLFRYGSQDLPFDFRSLKFGDFREDTTFASSYYAGMGLLAGAHGSNASLTVREASGRMIQGIAYRGQSLIVLGGWESVSRDDRGSVIADNWGSMAIPAHDWKDGSWIPETGILIEHPSNVTVVNASLNVMVFEPASSTAEIPEFSPAGISLLAVLVVLMLRRKATEHRLDREKNGNGKGLDGPVPGPALDGCGSRCADHSEGAVSLDQAGSGSVGPP